MSEFATPDFNSRDYSLFRPSYSAGFFKYILKYAGFNKNEWDSDTLSIVDIGSGPGTCIITLLPIIYEYIKLKDIDVKKVEIYVSDVSEVMLNEAKKNINHTLEIFDDKNLFTIKYLRTGGEEIANSVKEESIDVVLAAECAHWLNVEKWFESVHQILKSNTGVFAYWGYVDPNFIKVNGNKEAADKVNIFYQDFVYEKGGKLGPYWEQPGRRILCGLYKGINNLILKDKRWKDNVICTRDIKNQKIAIINKAPNFTIDKNILKIAKNMKVIDFLSYMDTWSSSSKWNKENPTKGKISLLFYEQLESVIAWKLTDSIEVEMQTVYSLNKKQ